MDRPMELRHRPQWKSTERLSDISSPRIRRGAKAMISDLGRVLLIRERRADGSTFWTLPGGGIHPSETPAAGLRRELHEELQVDTTIGPVIATCTYDHISCQGVVTCYRIFACDLHERPTPNHGEGIIAQTWAAPSELPRTTLAPFRRVLQACSTSGVIDDSPDRHR